jgi:hypothetical protein
LASYLELSEPILSKFNPDAIPWQRRVVDLIDGFDYSLGNLEILLSGAYGSAKSVLVAHVIVTHCLDIPGACAAVGRRSLGDLKKTLWKEILEHVEQDLKEGLDYWVNKSEMTITFANGSQIIGVSWADGRYAKFRSLKLSLLAIEEMTENDEDDQEAFKQLKARLRRIRGISENIFIGATNPDDPTHWLYTYFIEPNLHGKQHRNRYVFYSRTDENPFLDPVYKEQLKKDLPPKEALRFLEGIWLELRGDVIYSEYVGERQYLHAKQYVVNPSETVHLSFDFNIAVDKPMSAVMFQYINDQFHIFAESVIEGARTADIVEDFDARGFIQPNWRYEINGDASGKHRDTRSSRSDYDIIKHELSSRGAVYDYNVPLANPAIRKRHNTVNAYCKNAAGEVRLWIYQGCPTADKGMRLTKLKDAGNYIEDDSKSWQHISTAIGYGCVSTLTKHNRKPSGTRIL